MIARQVSMVLKASCTAQITRTIKNEVIPLLRKQKGFKDETTFVVPDGTEAIAYLQVLELLARVVEGTTEVKTLEVSNSTHHKIAARAAAAF